MSLKPEGEEPKAATKQVKRKNPDDIWTKVTEFKETMDSVVIEALNLLEKHHIPPDWTTFDPCDDEGNMVWMWIRPKNRYWLRIYVPTKLASVDADKGETLEEVSLRKAVRRLKRMIADDEEDEEEEED